MRLIKNKRIFILFAVVLISVFLSITVSAANAPVFNGVTIEDGKFVGLQTSKYGVAEYAYVTLEDFNGTNGDALAMKISGTTVFTDVTANTTLTENGIVCVRYERVPGDRAYFYVEGSDVTERSEIAELQTYQKTDQQTGVTTNFINMPCFNNKEQQKGFWVKGMWTDSVTISPEHAPWVENWHLSGTLYSNFLSDPTNQTYINNIINKLESVRFRYAYLSHEIIPVEELYKFSFSYKVRQGSLSATSPSATPFKGKFTLYTMSESGSIEAHVKYLDCHYSTTCVFSLDIAKEFPNAKGYVMGVEIYPYAEVPADVKFAITGGVSTNIALLLDYDGYVTKWNNKDLRIPVQYNGVNKSYIEGYSDNTFRPDDLITKAEASTILARLLSGKDDAPSGYESSFLDVTPNDWFYNIISFLEANDAFGYVKGNKLNPNEAITRGELAQLLYSASVLNKKNQKCYFVDVDESHEYYDAISYFTNIGVIKGYEDNSFRPYNAITRAEAITLFNRLMNLTVNEKTVDEATLENNFVDVDDHWAKLQILMASNDNVKTKNHIKSKNGLKETADSVIIETDHVKITISKALVRVAETLNKNEGENVASYGLNPWFTTIILDTGLTVTPKSCEVVDGRLKVTYANDVEAYFIIETFDNYFTVELDSELPHNVSAMEFGRFEISCEFSTYDSNSYRISEVPMTTTTSARSLPGGSTNNNSTQICASTHSILGEVIGAKTGITFSRHGGLKDGEHRKYLKEICLAIDPEVGLTSNMGGPFTYDESAKLNFADYVISYEPLTPENALRTAEVANKYSIDIIDLMQGGTYANGTFRLKTVKDAAEFKEKVADVMHENDVYLSLHTYSAMISYSETDILSNPKWQKQLAQNRENPLTLSKDLAASETDKTDYVHFEEDYLELGLLVPWGGGTGKSSVMFLIDEEIVTVYGDPTKTCGPHHFYVKRGMYGTKAVAHKAGAKITQLYYHLSFQPEPGSELFWWTADRLAELYNAGDFDMIYLDGFEAVSVFVEEKNLLNYYYKEFVRRVISQCNKKPVIEASANGNHLWAASGRPGALDHTNRQYKKINLKHALNGENSAKSYRTATLGWFHYAPGKNDKYINATTKTLFRDDLDYMGTLAIAFDFSTTLQPFSIENFSGSFPQLAENYQYYNIYSRLRKAGYFSEKAKETLRENIKTKAWEYRLTKDGNEWIFVQMYYNSHIVQDMSNNDFVSGKATNFFAAQKPYIRIEQRYSALKNAAETVVLNLDESKSAVSQVGVHPTLQNNLASKQAFKVKVTGNNSASDALLITLKPSAENDTARVDFFIPLNFTGEREFILIDSDTKDYGGTEFPGVDSVYYHNLYSNTTSMSKVNFIQISARGNCNGVKIGDIRACEAINAPAVNPSITIGTKTITFNTTINSGEYIEYFPGVDKAYQYYYDITVTDNTPNNIRRYKAITFTGSVDVPSGAYTYTYDGDATNNTYLRARVTIGLQDDTSVVRNEDGYNAPTVVMPKDSDILPIGY